MPDRRWRRRGGDGADVGGDAASDVVGADWLFAQLADDEESDEPADATEPAPLPEPTAEANEPSRDAGAEPPPAARPDWQGWSLSPSSTDEQPPAQGRFLPAEPVRLRPPEPETSADTAASVAAPSMPTPLIAESTAPASEGLPPESSEAGPDWSAAAAVWGRQAPEPAASPDGGESERPDQESVDPAGHGTVPLDGTVADHVATGPLSAPAPTEQREDARAAVEEPPAAATVPSSAHAAPTASPAPAAEALPWWAAEHLAATRTPAEAASGVDWNVPTSGEAEAPQPTTTAHDTAAPAFVPSPPAAAAPAAFPSPFDDLPPVDGAPVNHAAAPEDGVLTPPPAADAASDASAHPVDVVAADDTQHARDLVWSLFSADENGEVVDDGEPGAEAAGAPVDRPDDDADDSVTAPDHQPSTFAWGLVAGDDPDRFASAAASGAAVTGSVAPSADAALPIAVPAATGAAAGSAALEQADSAPAHSGPRAEQTDGVIDESSAPPPPANIQPPVYGAHYGTPSVFGSPTGQQAPAVDQPASDQPSATSGDTGERAGPNAPEARAAADTGIEPAPGTDASAAEREPVVDTAQWIDNASASPAMSGFDFPPTAVIPVLPAETLPAEPDSAEPDSAEPDPAEPGRAERAPAEREEPPRIPDQQVAHTGTHLRDEDASDEAGLFVPDAVSRPVLPPALPLLPAPLAAPASGAAATGAATSLAAEPTASVPSASLSAASGPATIPAAGQRRIARSVQADGTDDDGGSGSHGLSNRTLLYIAAGLGVVLVLVLLFWVGTRIPGMGTPVAAPAPIPTSTAAATPAPEVTTPAVAGAHPWDQLAGTECVDPYTDAWAQDFTVVDCAAPHAAQLVYRGSFGGDATTAFPGEDALEAQIDALCGAAGNDRPERGRCDPRPADAGHLSRER